MNGWFRRGDLAERSARGGCKNCGSDRHNARDCTERPRKEPIRHLQMRGVAFSTAASRPQTFDERRDRFAGYETADHTELANACKIEETINADIDESVSLDEESAQRGPDVDTRARNVRSLRSRDDLPRYLAAEPPCIPPSSLQRRLQEQERFLAKSAPGGIENSAALPTTAELLFKNALEEEKIRQSETRAAIMQRYAIDGIDDANNVERALRSKHLRREIEARKFDPAREELSARRTRVTKIKKVNSID